MQLTVNRSPDKSVKCLSLGQECFSLARKMSEAESVSVSAFLRGLIKKTYAKWSRSKKKLEEVETE